MKVELLYFEGCPHWETADRRLRQLAREAGFELDRRLIASADEAREAGLRGSPTILIDGQDPFAAGDESPGLFCRIYRTPDGVAGAPSTAQLRAALSPPR